jgi:Ca2+-transporting ATPase
VVVADLGRDPARSVAWHRLDRETVLATLASSPRGLHPAEARERLGRFGPNTLAGPPRPTALRRLAAQFTDVLILVLLAAALVSVLVGELTDAVVILAIVALNGGLGFLHEHRAERAMATLQAAAAPTARVLRAGRAARVAAAEIVPGDVVLLEAGDVVPADGRLLDVAGLQVDEAPLTGESVPVAKTADPLPEADVPVGDRVNMVHQGTVVTRGRGTAVVVATGMATEFGKVAALLRTTPGVQTPLQRRLSALGRLLAVAAVLIAALVFGTGLLRGEHPILMFLTAVSLAVAAVPEALPAVVTVTLALGARTMARRQALVRRLPAVETLGAVTCICSDKTGTLTVNRMRVEALYCDGGLERAARRGGAWEELLRAMVLSNDAAGDGVGPAAGDPTEMALRVAAEAAGLRRTDLERERPRLAELPFDPERRRMTTFHALPDGAVVSYTKGAPEVVLDLSAHVLTAAGPVPIPRQALVEVSERLASDGLRVLAFAMRRWPQRPPTTAEHAERDLILLGFVGLIDPPRPEAADAVRRCRAAGIVPVMVTGDHPLTARAIARRLGIVEDGGVVVTGGQLARLSPAELEERVVDVRVYARVSPPQKLDIVRALQARGQVVAVTGDGVNDAPALEQADIGVAMGVAGTDVARQASDLVLLDDNFATIVRAVQEGRRIYDNLRRFVRYSLTTNSAEVWTIFLAPVLGLPLPLLPTQILWINLVTDGLPGLALTGEPAARDLMQRPPRRPDESLFAGGLGLHVLWVGLLMGGLALGTQALYLDTARWQTMVFAVLSFAQLAHVMAIRSERDSVMTLGLLSNAPLAGAVGFTVALQLAVIYVPFLNRLLHTAPLSAVELAAGAGISMVVFLAVEVEKWAMRVRDRGRPGRAPSPARFSAS